MSELSTCEDPNLNESLLNDIVLTLGLILDSGDRGNLPHSWRTAVLACGIAAHSSCENPNLLFHAGLLHDIGVFGEAPRSGVRSSRPAAMTHAEKGARIVAGNPLLRELEPAIRDHHERFDGHGLPLRKRGEEISSTAAILHAADLIEQRLDAVEPDQEVSMLNKLLSGDLVSAVAPNIVDATVTLFETDNTLLTDLRSTTSLRNRISRLSFVPAGLTTKRRSTVLNEVLWLFGRIVDAVSPVRTGHSTRVAFSAFRIAKSIEMPDSWSALWAGMLHDVGKVGPSTVLPDPLQKDRAHKTLAIIAEIRGLSHLALPAAAHQERYDGGGPLGLAGDDIPVIGRILAISKTYDMKTGLRLDAASPEQALTTLRAGAGTLFDPQLVDPALAVLAKHGLRALKPRAPMVQPRQRRTSQSGVSAPEAEVEFLYKSFLNSNEAAFFTNALGHIVAVNRAFLTLYDYRFEEVAGRLPFEILVDEDSLSFDLWDNAMADSSARPWSSEVTTIASDGREVFVHLTITPVLDKLGTPSGYICHAVDISLHKRLEEELEAKNSELTSKNLELERLDKIKSNLMAITSHDLKAPIGAIIDHTQQLGEQLDELSLSEQRNALSKISESANDLILFVNDILTLDRIDSGTLAVKLQPTRLDRVLAKIIDRLQPSARSKDVEIRLASCRETKYREELADAGRMEQVFSNLLSNAVRYSPAGARVDVSFTQKRGFGTQIEIADEGPGIPAVDRVVVFERYYQVEGGAKVGTGLGLAIVKHIVDQHEGQIYVKSRAGSGSMFVIELPRTTLNTTAERFIPFLAPKPEQLASLERALGRYGACALPVLGDVELRCCLESEQPALVVVNVESVSRDQLATLRRYQQERHSPALVGVGVVSSELADLFTDSLTPPVLDAEFAQLLETIGLTGERSAVSG